jgi:hypothetical protein
VFLVVEVDCSLTVFPLDLSVIGAPVAVCDTPTDEGRGRPFCDLVEGRGCFGILERADVRGTFGPEDSIEVFTDQGCCGVDLGLGEIARHAVVEIAGRPVSLHRSHPHRPRLRSGPGRHHHDGGRNHGWCNPAACCAPPGRCRNSSGVKSQSDDEDHGEPDTRDADPSERLP